MDSGRKYVLWGYIDLERSPVNCYQLHPRVHVNVCTKFEEITSWEWDGPKDDQETKRL